MYAKILERNNFFFSKEDSNLLYVVKLEGRDGFKLSFMRTKNSCSLPL